METYALPYDPEIPLIRMDEQPIQQIRALYIYEHKTDVGTAVSLIDLLLLIHTDYNPGLEIVVFVGELNYIVNEEGKGLEVLQEEDIKRVMRRATEVLEELCWRMGI